MQPKAVDSLRCPSSQTWLLLQRCCCLTELQRRTQDGIRGAYLSARATPSDDTCSGLPRRLLLCRSTQWTFRKTNEATQSAATGSQVVLCVARRSLECAKRAILWKLPAISYATASTAFVTSCLASASHSLSHALSSQLYHRNSVRWPNESAREA